MMISIQLIKVEKMNNKSSVHPCLHLQAHTLTTSTLFVITHQLGRLSSNTQRAAAVTTITTTSPRARMRTFDIRRTVLTVLLII